MEFEYHRPVRMRKWVITCVQSNQDHKDRERGGRKCMNSLVVETNTLTAHL